MLTNLRLLKHQKPMLKTIGKIILGSVKKGKNVDPTDIPKASAEFTVTPPVSVVEQYHKWLNTTAKYQNTVAPHLYPQWAIPELFKLGEEYSLPFHKILNQGCSIKVNGKIPKGQNLMGKVQIFDIMDLDTKIRINQKVWTGPKENPMAIEAEIHAVMLKNNKQSFSKKKENPALDLSKAKEICKVYISAMDAKNYGLISGDINPIHMSKVMAKVFGLKASLMHGFGLKAIIFEELERNGYLVSELSLKFLMPVFLNHYIRIFLEENAPGDYTLLVVDDKESKLHLTGQLKTRA